MDLWHLVPEGSVYRFLAENRRRLFPDEMFSDLFGPRGRPSIPGPVIAAVMVLQALECLSDREAIQRLRRDIAWKAAAGLSLTHGGFHPTVLTLWRARLRASDRPERIFDAVRQVMDSCGVLANKDRRALDSTILDDAVATQDTVTMISSQIRRCRRLIPQAADLVLVAHDYESKTKPSCDWSDPDSRSELVDGLVGDGLAVIDTVEDIKLDPDQADAVGLLGVVTGQDVEPDPDREGRWRIARRVAKDRTISTVDTESRHGHKTRTSKRDGYKAHVATEPETGLVTAAVLTAANTTDADSIADLVADQPPGAEIVADSAYASGSALETFDDLGHTPVVKPIVRKPHIKDGFHRDDFDIDTGARTVTCPAGHTARLRPGGTAPFAKRCNGCPLRARCTTSKTGRTITVDKHHDLRAANKTRWAKDETRNTYRNLRPSVERTIAWLTRGKARRVPYRGIIPNQQWLTTRTAAINLRRLINLGDRLFELRVGLDRVARRITFYFADNRRIVLLTTFRKQRQNERAEVRRARRAMRRCLAEGHAPEEE